jgi:uncharacterized protein
LSRPFLARRGVVLAALTALLAGGAAAQPANQPQPTLKIEPLEIVTSKGVHHFKVEMAETTAERETGEMFRTSVGPGQGMLFDFHKPQVVAFWMKNTLIPLDMLFIGADGRIISIVRNAQPHDESAMPAGGVVALGVLELAGGRAAEIDAEPGDKVRQRIFKP